MPSEPHAIPMGPAEDLLAQFQTAVADDLTTLAALHHQEVDDALLEELNSIGFPACLGLRLAGPRGKEAQGFLQQALKELLTPLTSTLLDELAADYAAIYLNHGYTASPCESFWVDEENLVLQAPMFGVREFYKRHGLAVADWHVRSDDHLVHELRFLAVLLQTPHASALPEAARFLDEHLLRWLPRFSERVAKRCDTPFYAGAAWLTAEYCEELRGVLAEVLDTPRPTADEIDARMRPKAQGQVAPLTYVPGLSPSW